WRLPEQIVVPIASGSQLTKVDKGFKELAQLGLVDDTAYKIFGAQATGCSPVSSAFRNGHDVVQPVKPDTIARSLAIGNPADGPYVLDTVNRTGGAIEDVTDDEVVEGIRLLARTEGIFTETAGGVTVATAKKLIEAGKIDPDAETVLLITGDGLKTLDAVEDQIGPNATVPPSAAAVNEIHSSRRRPAGRAERRRQHRPAAPRPAVNRRPRNLRSRRGRVCTQAGARICRASSGTRAHRWVRIESLRHLRTDEVGEGEHPPRHRRRRLEHDMDVGALIPES